MTIFITRDLAENSIFRSLLEAQGGQVRGFSLVEFAPQPFDRLPAADWYFFYSANGVHFFMEQVKMKQIDVLPTVRWAAIGEGTARALEKYTQKIDFYGSGHPEETAEAFLARASGQRVLFVQAEHSQQSIATLLRGKIEMEEFVVYTNQPKTDFEQPDADVLVFTSPLNVQAFMQQKGIRKRNQKVISIGKTTARELEKWGVLEYVIAADPQEKSLAEAVLSVLE